MSQGFAPVTQKNQVTATASLPLEPESGQTSFQDVLRMLVELRGICDEIILNAATLKEKAAETKNALLLQQLADLEAAAKEMAKADKGGLFGRIFGMLSLALSAVFVVLCPTPMSIAAFGVTLALVIDSEVASHVEGYDGMLGELSSKLMEAMENLPPSLAATLSAVVMIAVVIAAIAISAVGVGMVFPGLSAPTAQNALLNIFSQENATKVNYALETSRIISQSIEIVMQVYSSVKGLSAAQFNLSSDDLTVIIRFMESCLQSLDESSQKFTALSDVLNELYNISP